MPSLKDFVEALEAGWLPSLSCFLGCMIILAGDWYRIPYISGAPTWLTTTAAWIGVFAASILLANAVRIPIFFIKRLKVALRRHQFRREVDLTIDELPQQEKEILAYLISSKRKAFTASLNNASLSPLVSRGFIIRRPGSHDILEWPYVVNDYVWQYLLDNFDQFHMPDAENMRNPLSWRRGYF